MIYDDFGHHSPVVQAGEYLFLSNVLGTLPDGRLARGWDDLPSDGRALKTNVRPLDAREGLMGAQAWMALARLAALLREHGSSLARVCKMQVYLTNKKLFPFYERVRARVGGPFPPNSCLEVDRLDPSGEALIAFDVVAAVRSEGGEAGPSQSIAGTPSEMRTREHLWLSGTIPLDPDSQATVLDWPDLVGGGPPGLLRGRFDVDYWEAPMMAQTLEVQRLIERRLAARGLGFEDVVRCAVYLRNLRDYPAFERAYRMGAPRAQHPWAVIQVNDISSTTDIVLEIDAVAALPAASPRKIVVCGTPELRAAGGVFAVRSGGLLFVGTRVGLDASGRSIADRVDDASGARLLSRSWGRLAPSLERTRIQTAAILDAMAAGLAPAGFGMRHLCKLNVCLTDFRDCLAVSETLAAYFPDHPPAISIVQVPVAGPGRGTVVAIDAIGAVAGRDVARPREET